MDHDVAIVGAGAAGMMAALAARGAIDREGRRSKPADGAPRVLLLDGAARLGRKILVSGGGRCNVTNERVTDADFESDAPHVVRGLLAAFPVASIRRFLEDGGVALYAEPLGKLFPRTDRAQDVLQAFLAAVEDAGVLLVTGSPVRELRPADGGGWSVTLVDGRSWTAARVVVATGGKSLPKTGSTGFGFELAPALGHRIEEPLPALTPVVSRDGAPLAGLSGVTVPAILSVVPPDAAPEQVSGARFRPLARAAGSVLVTHRGLSGPAALDVSGACARALAEGRPAVLRADFWTLARDESPWQPWRDLAKPPGACLPPDGQPRPVTLEVFLEDVAPERAGRRGLAVALAARIPRSLAEALLRAGGVDAGKEARALGAAEWRRTWAALVHADLGLSAVTGFDKAEVTAGGVRLSELHRTTLESRLCPGLHFCGEVVNATGRLGGFNFQWAWSSGFAAGAAAGAAR